MGSDRIHMDVGAVRHHMEQVADVGREIATAWAARHQELRAFEPGIGSGVIGAAIRAAYDAPSQAVSAAAAKLPELYTAMADAGRAAADDYVRTDQDGAGAIAGVPGAVDRSRL